jgi:thiol:disulfide interchange protein DsbC
MKFLKTILSTSAALAVSATVAFAGQELTPDQVSKLKAEYPELIGKPGIKVLKGMDQGKFSQLELEVMTPRGPQQFEVFVVDGLENAIFAGNAYDKTGKKYNLPKNVDLIKEGVAFKVGHGPEQIYLVTEPECPYCQRLEKNLAPDVGEKFTINVIPMPLSFHKKATPMFYWVFAAETEEEKAKRLHAVMTGDKEFEKFTPTAEQKAKFDEMIKKGYGAAMELKAGGTPSVYNADFEKIDYSMLVKKQ